MAKPVGARCNLACSYCYYLEKGGMYGDGGPGMMTDDLLELFIKQYMACQTQREVLFTWHGGEPLLRPLSFYRRVVALQRKHAGGHLVDNCIQTNGTLLTEEWCRFLKDNNWLVGVSLDGPQWMHDRHRRDNRGEGTFQKVMRGVELLDRHGVEWNAMAVVNSHNAEHPREFYRFFRDIGCRFIQFTPVVERAGAPLSPPLHALPSDGAVAVTAETVAPRQWGEFLCTVFDEWVVRDVGEIFVQIFDATLANWVGVEPGVCSMAAFCGNALAMEHNGDVSLATISSSRNTVWETSSTNHLRRWHTASGRMGSAASSSSCRSSAGGVVLSLPAMASARKTASCGLPTGRRGSIISARAIVVSSSMPPPIWTSWRGSGARMVRRRG